MKGLVAANYQKLLKNFFFSMLRIVTLDWTTPYIMT